MSPKTHAIASGLVTTKNDVAAYRKESYLEKHGELLLVQKASDIVVGLQVKHRVRIGVQDKSGCGKPEFALL